MFSKKKFRSEILFQNSFYFLIKTNQICNFSLKFLLFLIKKLDLKILFKTHSIFKKKKKIRYEILFQNSFCFLIKKKKIRFAISL